MSIAKKIEGLSQPTSEEVKFAARTEFDGTSGFIQTAGLRAEPKDYTELLEQFGYDPSEVRIIGVPRVSRWQVWGGEWLSAYKFQIAPVSKTPIDDLVGLVGKYKAHKPQESSGVSVFNFQAGDQQLGKIDGDGTEGTVERFLDSLEVAKQEFKSLKKRRNIGGINLMFPGDCIEGVVSQNGRNMWRTELTLTEQLRLFRRLLMKTVEEFAPLSDNVWLRVVNGNHDEATRVQNTRPDDGFATEQAIAVADALKMNTNAFGHVVVEVPPVDQGYMTVKSFDTVYTIAHGHQWRRGKAMDWIANQALHSTNVSACDILVHGHEHRWTVDTNGARKVICSPTYDGGSLWLENGSHSLRGGLTYVTSGSDVTDMRLV
jgi:UDP-2,3-diacylglucosamine pyrophosphatase LpxH